MRPLGSPLLGQLSLLGGCSQAGRLGMHRGYTEPLVWVHLFGCCCELRLLKLFSDPSPTAVSPYYMFLWSHPLCPPPVETSPEQRGSEVHTKKTVMIKTIETRDGEVSAGWRRRVVVRQGTEDGPCFHTRGSGVARHGVSRCLSPTGGERGNSAAA